MRPLARHLPVWTLVLVAVVLAPVAGLAGPLITGCFGKCGVTDQSCVTQCQVCVEKHGCRSLGHGCGVCLQKVQQLLRQIDGSSSAVLDSGGAPQAYDALRTRKLQSTIRSMYATRALIGARSGVIEAQRGVEYAAAERRESHRRLKAARERLHGLRAKARKQGSGEAREEVREASRVVRAGVADLRAAKRMEEWLRQRLDQAKHSYVTAAAKREKTAKTGQRLDHAMKRVRDRWKHREAGPHLPSNASHGDAADDVGSS